MITKKQQKVLDFIEKSQKKHKYSPTLEEIQGKFKLASVSTAHYYIQQLKNKGYLSKQESQHRAISVLPINKTIRIPILGNIAAGPAIEAIETFSGFITIPENEIRSPEKCYALKAVGDSMIDDGVFDGDIVVIRSQTTADDGKMVVAIIDDNQTTLKRIYHEKDRIRLQPANQNFLPFYRTEVEIRGIVEKIIRNPNALSKIPNKNSLLEREKQKVENNSESIFLTKQHRINQIYNIDCLELAKSIRDNSIDLIFADPPYNLSGSNFKMKFIKSGGADLNTNKGQWDHYSDLEFEEFTKKWLAECFRILKKNGSIWVAGSYHNIYLTGYLMKKLGFEILNEILWHKSDATPNLSCTRFVADHENFIWARKGKGNIFNYDIMKKLNGGKQMRSMWTKGKTAGGKRIHPTQKPEWLLERVISATSNPDSIVFDPFLGSGTTAVVAKKYGRQYLGAELDHDYFKKAVERINQTTCKNII